MYDHDASFCCMGLQDKADTVGRMLQQLERSIGAELTAIESVERRADDDRRMRWTAAVGFLTTVGLPLSLVLTFFGINAREVNQDRSMFDAHYLPMHSLLAAIIVAGLALSGGILVQQRRRNITDARRAREAMAAVRNMTVVRREPLKQHNPEGPTAVANTPAIRPS